MSADTRGLLETGTAFGHFSIEGVLGHGLSGPVYLARQQRMGRLVALKVLSTDLSADRTFRTRFVKCAMASGRLSHPGIATVDDVGLVDRNLWIATRLVDATDASQLLAQHGRLPVRRVAALLDQLAVVVDYLHRQDMTAIDVTPANVLVDTRVTPETVTLVDNCVARALADEDRPEEEARRDDVYSLACTVYELLTGSSPIWEGGRHHPVTPAKTLVAALPRQCDVALQSALAVDPARRFSSASAFATAFRRGLGAADSPAVTAVAAPPKRSRMPMWVAAGTAVVAVVGGVAIFGDDSSKKDEAQVAPVVQPYGLHDFARIGADGQTLKPTTGADPAGDGKAVCSNVSLGVMGALSGDDTVIGAAIAKGVKLAVDRHNAHNPKCEVGLYSADTQGTAVQARRVADALVENSKVVGVVGPAYSDEVTQTGQKFTAARLVAVSPSASSPGLTNNGWAAFFRGVPDRSMEGTAVGKYIEDSLGAQRVCVIGDGSSDALTQTAAVTTALGQAVIANCSTQAQVGNSSAVAQRVANAEADAVFFAGSPSEAASWLTSLRDAGVTAKFVAGDGVKSPDFIDMAGETARDSIVAAPWGPASTSFAAMYREAYKEDPEPYAAEGFDVATILLRGIDAGKVKRLDLLNFVRAYDGAGFQGRYSWDADGELDRPGIWLYRADGVKK
ncbi:MAG: bifunctional serine/threonine-protein kinase/ABC transporter substrate-binding protein [Nocardiaceae bacterium]|nr:bifunctional serine/threonine-protein kinase/ABC transporter substrate-binding protein [Nocardiaceae bacterium]